MEPKESSLFDSTNLVLFLIKKRKPLIIITLAAAVVSSIVSLLIDNKFQSTVIMFPANSNSISKTLMAEDVTGKNDITAFGEEEQAEQMLQILNSDEIRWKIIEKYNLMQHYEIDQDEKYKLTKLYKEYDSNISFKRTEFMSVRIDVLDKNPDTAAMIANDIAALLDSARNRMQQDRAREGLAIIEDKYFEMRDYLQLLEDSLTTLREYGVHDYEKQIEMLSQEYYKVLAQGNTSAAKKLEDKLEVLAKYGSAHISMTEILEYERERLALLRAKYEETKADAERSMTYKFIVNNAYPSEKKAYPIRWLIVVVSTISTLVLAILSLIFIENYKRFKVEE